MQSLIGSANKAGQRYRHTGCPAPFGLLAAFGMIVGSVA
jgi:hypothetical protein